MISVYIGPRLSVSHLPLLFPFWGSSINQNQLAHRHLEKTVLAPSIKITANPHRADYILIPHDYYLIKENAYYLNQYQQLSDKYRKELLIFYYGDRDDQVHLNNCIVLRTSQYRQNLRPTELIMPAYVEDFGKNTGSHMCHHSTIPTIGFCGWAEYKNGRQRLAFFIKTFGVKEFMHPGLKWRQRCLNELQKSSSVKINFIIRKSFSGHTSTIEVDPQVARNEYIANIKASDYVLCVKGDGNYSLRFYETLSLNRLPLLLDTECPLPLENKIPYDKFCCRIPWLQWRDIAVLVRDHYDTVDEEQFISMQRMARQYFERYLRIDKFFEYLFKKEQVKRIVHENRKKTLPLHSKLSIS